MVGVTVTSTVNAGAPRKAAQKGATTPDWSWARSSTSSLSDAPHGVHRAAALETSTAAGNRFLKDTILGEEAVTTQQKRVTGTSDWKKMGNYSR